MLTLPPGSLYVSAIKPELSWPKWRHAIADLQDDLWAVAFARAGCAGEPPHVTRPAEVIERVKAARQNIKTKTVIETTEWEQLE